MLPMRQARSHCKLPLSAVSEEKLTIRPECAPSLVMDNRVASVEVTEVDRVVTVVDSLPTSRAT